MDADEEMRTGESEAKKAPRCSHWCSQCVSWPCAKMGMIRDMIRYGIRFRRDPHAAMQNVKVMGIVVSCGKVTFKDVRADVV